MPALSGTANKMKKKDKANSGGVGEFLRETRGEWDKTTFPSSDDVRNTTIIVVISVIFVAVYLFLVDKMWVVVLDGFKAVVNWIAGI